MQLAVFYHHIKEAAKQTGQSELDILKKAKEAGITQLEFDIFDLQEKEKMLLLLKESGFLVSSIYGFYDFGRKQNGTDGYALIDAAVTFGSKKIMIIPGFYKQHISFKKQEEKNRMVEQMEKMCAYAVQKDIVPTIEDFDDKKSPIAKADQMLSFAKLLPDLKITFDTGNFMYSAQPELEAYEILRGRIVHVHCKDRALYPLEGTSFKEAVDKKKLYPASVGSGSVAMTDILRNLKTDGYDGTLTIEHFDTSNYFECMLKSAEWLTHTWEELK